MKRPRLIRRILSVVLAAAMLMPAISVAVEAATMTWLSPLPGESITQRQVEVSVGYNTQSNLQVTRMQLWIDGKHYATKTLVRPESRGVASFIWDTSKFSRGLHDLVVKIYAGDELVTSISGSSTIGDTSFDLRAPVVRFANIKSGDVLKGTSIVRMKVTDDGGEAPVVSLLVDSVLKYLTNREPYAYPLDTTKYTDGSHELQTFAYDQAGNKSDPAVVKVSFSNSLKKPVVSTLSVDPRSAPTAASEDDGVGVIIPPAVSESAGKGKSVSAARAPEPTIRTEISGTVAKPAGRPAEPKMATTPKLAANAQRATASVKPVERVQSTKVAALALAPSDSPAAAEVKELAPPLESGVRSPQSGTSSAGIRMAKVTQNSVRSRLGISEPTASMPIAESSAKVATGPASPTTKATRASAAPIARQAITPSAGSSPAASSSRTPRAVASPVVRPAQGVVVARSIEPTSPAPKAIQQAPAASTLSTVTSSAVSGIRGSASPARVVEGGPSLPNTIVSNPTTSSAKPIQTAMLPAIRGGSNPASGHNALANPPAPRKDIRAKLEKRTVAVKGKMKLRDLIDGIGGILFWDAETHTVTAYTRDFKLEITIGSPIVLVNGREIRTTVLPRIVAGRTIVDASLYAQACAAVGNGERSADSKH